MVRKMGGKIMNTEPNDDYPPKTDYYERQLARADKLRDESKDREWEAWNEKRKQLAEQRDAEREGQP